MNTDTTSLLATLPQSTLVALLAQLPMDTPVPTLRSLGGTTLTIADVVDYKQHDWRVYDANCPYDFSHTTNFCGYPLCSDS